MTPNQSLARDRKADNEALRNAARAGDANRCRELSRLGADVNSKDSRGLFPLILAASASQNDTCLTLLNHGAAIDEVDRSQMTALIWASRWGNVELCELLIDRGANIECKDDNGLTPLAVAALNQKHQACIALSERGADLEAKDKEGRTVLATAAARGLESTCLVLLNQGASLETRNQLQMTPLMLAARYGHAALCMALVDQGADIEARDINGDTALAIAVYNGHDIPGKLSVALALVICGANVRTVPSRYTRGGRFAKLLNRSFLSLAVETNDVQVINRYLPKTFNAQELQMVQRALEEAGRRAQEHTVTLLASWIAKQKATQAIDLIEANCSAPVLEGDRQPLSRPIRP